MKELVNLIASLAFLSVGSYFLMFTLDLFTFIHIFRYLLSHFAVIFVKKNTYTFYTLLGTIGFIGDILIVHLVI